MANKMLVDRMDDLENQLEWVVKMLGLSTEFMELITGKLPQYDMLLENRKKVLSKAKAMRLAKRKKRQEMSGAKGAKKDAR